MNDRYGVDPCAADSVSELASLLRMFGPEHGRFIIDFPPEWHVEVRKAFREIGDIEAKYLSEWLARARRYCLPTDTRYSSALPWAKNAAFLEDARALVGPVDARPPCRPLKGILMDPAALPDSRGKHIPRDARAYAEAARPLMQLSRKVVLIDPYFALRYPEKTTGKTPMSRYVDSVRSLLRAAREERRVEVFKVMVSRDKTLIGDESGQLFVRDFHAIAQAVGATDIAIEVGYLSESASGNQHARYLLGNECGLHFDWGFDTKPGDSLNHVEWMGRAALKPLLDKYF